jgi:response regulator RpfG family c-di-GMP phosphodiesterase
MTARMNREIVEGYLEGTIGKSIFMEEYNKVYGGGGQQSVRKSDDELIRKSVEENDNVSYLELRRQESIQKAEIKKQSRQDLEEVTEEFNRIMGSMVRKENESNEQMANRVWSMANSDGVTLYERYQSAMRNLML